jgi:MFS transporter, Spinster family, sphingosine-1-phosphate transporter
MSETVKEGALDAASRASRLHPWLLVALLWVVGLLNYLDRQVIFSVFPLLSEDLRLSSTQLGLLSTVFLWVYGILSPLAGHWADRFGRARVILVSLIVWSMVTWATGHAGSFTELMWARALMGISEACYIPAALALIADYHGDRSRALASGVHNSGIYAGIVLGGAGGGWMGQQFGWRAAFTVLGIAGVLYFFVLLWLMREKGGPPEHATRPGILHSIRELVRLPGFAGLTVVFCGMSVANWIGYTWLPVFLYEKFHVSLASAGFTGTFYIQVGSVAGILLGGRLSDYWVVRTQRGRLLTQAAGLVLAAPFLFLTGFTSWFPLVAITLAVFGIGRGMFDANSMPVLCQIAPAGLRSTGYGIFNMAGCIVGGVMAAVAGFLKDRYGLGMMFQFAAGCLLASAIVLLRLRLDQNRGQSSFFARHKTSVSNDGQPAKNG